jgi:hypothetical protein
MITILNKATAEAQEKLKLERELKVAWERANKSRLELAESRK